MPELGGAVRTVWLVARREFVTRVRSRFFLIGTVVFMALVAGYIVLQAEVIGKSTTTVTVGFAGQAQSLLAPLKVAGRSAGIDIHTSTVADIASGDAQVRSGDLDVLVSGDPGAPEVAVKDTLDPTVEATLDALAKQVVLSRALAAAGTDPAAVEAQVAEASIHTTFLDPNAADRAQREVVGLIVAIITYVALLLYGQLVAQGVVEEKSNRIIEILLSTIRPRQLLLGKVLGIGLVGFLQLLLLGAAALVAVARTQVVSLPSLGLSSVADALLWFVLGFVFFAFIFAAGGSMVTRQEDAGAVIAPITMLIVGTYLAYFWVAANPTQPLAVVISTIPPFAPIIMPARMATGDAQAWQVVLSVILTIAGIAGLNGLAARIYSNSVIRVGARVKLLEAWRGAP